MLTLCRLLIGVGRSIVPLSFRDDWTREWQAELYHQTHPPAGEPLSRRARRALVFRCAGAVIHAAWLRKEEWSFSVLMQDVRYAIRGLRARAGFSAEAVAVS
jgi:hypothetical protein